MNDRDMEALLRAALSEQARALVPDDATAPTAPAGGLPRVHALAGSMRRHRIWWASSLVAAVAAVVVTASVLVSSEITADGPGPAASIDVDATATQPGPTTRGYPSVGPTPDPEATAISRPGGPSGGPGEAGAGATSSTPPAVDAAIFVRARCNSAPADDPPVTRPVEIGLACADAGENLVGLTWSSWAEDGARGAGELEWRTCPTDCAAGQVTHTAPVAVTLSGAVLVDGARWWTHVTLSSDPSGGGTDYTLQTTP